MLTIHDLAESTPAQRRSEPPAATTLDMLRLLDMLKRQWPSIVALTIVCLVLATGYIAVATPRYTATTRVLIETSKNGMLSNQQIIGEREVDTGLVDSQVEIIKSDGVAKEVIGSLNLANDPVFSTHKSVLGSLLHTSKTVEQDADGRDQSAIDAVIASTTVKRIGLTYVIEIGYTSYSPGLAAKVANGIADAYTRGELDAKYAATKRAGTWLQDQITALREQATAADQSVQDFKSKHDMVDTNRGLMSEQQLSDVNTQLVSARAAMAEAKARRDRILQIVNSKTIPDASVSDALHNDVITRLRAQYLDLSGRMQDLSARYGPNHSVVVKLKGQMDELQKSIANEMNRIAETYKSDLDIAQARMQSLQESMSQLLDQNTQGAQARVNLKDLESSAQTYRALYDNFLQKFTEATQQQTFPIGEARVISIATPPATASYPKKPLVIAGGLFLGLCAGIGMALGREMLKRTFQTAADVSRIPDARCLGILPAIPVKKGSDPKDVLRYAVDAPFTRFAETLRHIKVAVDVARASQEMKVVGIVSSLPQEGKTTVAANIASMVAASGRRTLLIDADLRTPSLSRRLTPGAKMGLFELLTHGMAVENCICVDEKTRLSVLPAGGPGRVSNTSELLSSQEMKDVLQRVRKDYDYVFIDFAPLSPVVDVKAASHLVDGFVMVIEWAKTSYQTVSEALESADQVHDRLLGVVLNRASMTALNREEGFKGKRYQNYYIEEAQAVRAV